MGFAKWTSIGIVAIGVILERYSDHKEKQEKKKGKRKASTHFLVQKNKLLLIYSNHIKKLPSIPLVMIHLNGFFL